MPRNSLKDRVVGQCSRLLMATPRKAVVWAIAFSCMSGIAWVDLKTGHELEMRVFYVLPLVATAWYVGGAGGFVLALLTVVARGWTDAQAGHTYSHAFYRYWMALNQLTTHLAVVWAFSRIRKELRGLVPVCAWCKQVRDEQGHWQTWERFIAERSLARFSHGICPACRNATFPDESEQRL